MIYKTFKIANQEIKTTLLDSLPGGEYGKFNDAKNEILIAKSVVVDDEVIELTEQQMQNTFFHEVIHAFQFYYNNEFDEAQAQVYANFICEMLESGQILEEG